MAQITKPLVLDETVSGLDTTLSTSLAAIASSITDGQNTVHYTGEVKTDLEKAAARTNIGAVSTSDFNSAITSIETNLETVNYLTTAGTDVTCSPNVNYYNSNNQSADFTLTLADATESSTKANEWHYVFCNAAASDIKVTLIKTNATFYTPEGYKVSGNAYLTADASSYCEISILRMGFTNNYLANICCYPNTELA